ncbi:hypothetical protein CDAR_97631 [Caerostris darwini]|uniref:Uncharacterized protein n=1 Tax=Caerostris darwini TaxID=1538125 RepID=A0AAV4NFB4_9ARAC|nr:hypothetical protein CDAR_97631 [Caerostris darwini]
MALKGTLLNLIYLGQVPKMEKKENPVEICIKKGCNSEPLAFQSMAFLPESLAPSVFSICGLLSVHLKAMALNGTLVKLIYLVQVPEIESVG